VCHSINRNLFNLLEGSRLSSQVEKEANHGSIRDRILVVIQDDPGAKRDGISHLENGLGG